MVVVSVHQPEVVYLVDNGGGGGGEDAISSIGNGNTPPTTPAQGQNGWSWWGS